MRIDRIRISHHKLRLDPPFPAAWDTRPRETFPATVVRVWNQDGLEGVGSGDAMHGFGHVAHLFLGQDPRDLERHARILENVSFHGSRCWPLDMALWDLVCKSRGEPVYQALGGRCHRVRAYASSGVHRGPEETAGVARSFLEAGLPAMKVRLGRKSLDADMSVLRAVRAEVGGALELMVDCNQGWRMPWDTATPWTLARALEVARSLEEFDVFWMEEPLHRGDYAGMAALRRATKVRLAGAEMTRESHQLHKLIDHACLDFLQPDVILAGGFLRLRELAARAQAHGMCLTPHTWGNGLGLLANLHLTAGCSGAPYLELPFDPPEWTPERRDFMLQTPILPDPEGWLVLDDKPGFGIELDEDRLACTLMSEETYDS